MKIPGAAASAGALGLGRFLLSLLVAPLPERWRRGLEERLELRTDLVGLPSASIQLASFFLAGLLGFEPWLRSLTDPLGGPLDSEAAMAEHALLWANPLLPLIYCLTTPLGWLALLGGFGGLLRLLVAAAHGGNAADPTLSLIDAGWARWTGRRRSRARESSKGERTRDVVERIPTGAEGELRIVSFDDYGWPEGTSVRAFGVTYSVTAVSEGTDPKGRLRTTYRLAPLAAAGVVRGLRDYEPVEPPLVRDDLSGL